MRFALLTCPYDLSSYSVSDIVGLCEMMLGCSTDAMMDCFWENAPLKRLMFMLSEL